MSYESGAPTIKYDYLHPTAKFGPHNGIDIAIPRGYSVLAGADGVVTFSGWDCCGGGNTVTIEHGKDGEGNFIRTVYKHNDENLVHKGQQVKRGQKIALSGQTGEEASDFPHLHFSVYKVRDGTWTHVSPHEYWLGIDEHRERLKTEKGAKMFVIPCFNSTATYASNPIRFTYPVECKR